MYAALVPGTNTDLVLQQPAALWHHLFVLCETSWLFAARASMSAAPQVQIVVSYGAFVPSKGSWLDEFSCARFGHQLACTCKWHVGGLQDLVTSVELPAVHSPCCS